MKQIKFVLIILLMGYSNIALIADTQPTWKLDLGIFSNTTNGNKLEFKIRPTELITNGTYSGGTFVVRYPTAYLVNLTFSSASYGYTLSGPFFSGGYTYYYSSFSTTTTGVDWVAGSENIVLTLNIVSNPGIPGPGVFELANDQFAEDISAATDGYYQSISNNGMPGDENNGDGGIFYNASTSAPLPIELTKFNAKAQADHTTQLDWEAATELNLSHYDVEHSSDGVNFNSIGKVSATGTQSGTAVYDFLHSNPVDGINYYRLKILDNNGAYEYSPIRNVVFDEVLGSFDLQPNPSTGPFSLMSTNLDKYKDDLRYQIFDVTGKLIEEGLVKDERLDFDLSNYKSGMYSFAILSNKEFIKQFQLILTTH